MAAPTLTANAGGTLLRIIGGSSGDPVTWNDVWDWDDGGGSSGGDGDVPLDGGGTAKVSTFMTEHVADALYQIHQDAQFGNGSTSSYFNSRQEQVLFDAGKTMDCTDAATLKIGDILSGGAVYGSSWSFALTGLTNIALSQTTSTFLAYDSQFIFRTAFGYSFRGGAVTFKNCNVCFSNGTSGAEIDFQSGISSLNLSDVYVSRAFYGFSLYLTPDTFENNWAHDPYYGIFCSDDASCSGLKITSASVEIGVAGAVTLTMTDSDVDISSLLLLHASSLVEEQYSVNVHVNDKDGADLESATVAATSYGNVVSNDTGSTFYRCIVDHTAGAIDGTFASDVSAGYWELVTGGEEVLAGCDGLAAETGAWVSGIAYVKAAQQFSVSTDSGGDITEQTIPYRKWTSTSEALLTYAPYTFVVSKAGCETLTYENVVPTAAISWSVELQDPVPDVFASFETETSVLQANDDLVIIRTEVGITN